MILVDSRRKASRDTGSPKQIDDLAALNARIGQNIRKFRKAQGYTQERLAEASNLSTFFIGSVERGQASISLRSLHQLAGVLGVQVSDLVNLLDSRQLVPMQRRANELIKRCS